MKVRASVLALLTLSAPAFARFLAADFEDVPLGPISSQPGWGDSAAALPIVYSAVVTNVGALRGLQCAELPAISTSLVLVTGTRIVNTNFVAQPAAGEGAVLRASVWIYRENLHDRMSVALGQTGKTFLYLYESAPGGTLIFSNAASGGSLDTGQRMVTGRYSQVVFHYDTASSDCSLDYDGRTLIDDQLGGPALTNFNRFSVFRSAYTGTPGRVFVDEMRLEAFPSYVTAWWRFDEFDPAYADDAVGSFFTTRMAYDWPERAAPADDFVWSGGRDVADCSAQRAHAHTNQAVWRPVVVGTNWTVEAFVCLQQNTENYDLLGLGHPLGIGVASTSTLLAVRMIGCTNHMTVNADLRDGQDPLTSSDYEPALGDVPCDSQWHHLALVKAGTSLLTYVDYQLTDSRTLSSHTDGTYYFRAFQGEADVGCTFDGGGKATTNHAADEIRLSAAALSPTQFLHRSSPHVVQLAPSILGPDAWALSFETPPGTSNSVQLATQLAPGDWRQAVWLTSTGHQMQAVVQAAGATNLLRVLRRLQP